MKKTLIILSLGLLTATSLYAGQNMNHSSENSSKKSMLHGESKPYHHMAMIDGYKVMLSSKGPLKRSTNNLTVVVMKDRKPVKDLDVDIQFTLASKTLNSTPVLKGKAYKADVKFDNSGHWMYKLNFKTNDNKIHTMKGNMDIK